MLSSTVETWIAVGIFMSPIPRSAADIATSGNCSASAGTNQTRYWTPSAAVAASAASERQYASRPVTATRPKASPTAAASTSAWLKTSSACSRCLRPSACATSAVAPTPIACVSASTMNARLPDSETPATASLPSLPTKYRSARK